MSTSPGHPAVAVWLLAFAACVAAPARSQAIEGSLSGTATPGTEVRIQNLESGQAVLRRADSAGRFVVPRLVPGRYLVAAGGVQREATVLVGAGTEVNFRDIQSIEVSARILRRPIDMSNFESGATYTREEIDRLPVARSFDAVALLTPGAVRGAFGSLVSFGGASVAENGYYINGFDVTNLRTMLSYASVPFDAMAQQQLKSGGMGAEYGRALGGVSSVITQRGGNEWRSGASFEWTPQRLRGRAVDVQDRDPDRKGLYALFQSADRSEERKAVLHLGGPLVREGLFVFGLVELPDSKAESFRQDLSTTIRNTRPQGLLKVDWLPGENHRVEFTGIWNKSLSRITDYTNEVAYSRSHDGPGRESRSASGGDVFIGSYTGHWSNDLTVSAQVGQVRYLRPTTTGARDSDNGCPLVRDVDFSALGCWIPPGGTPRDPSAPDDSDRRRGQRLDVDYSLGSHTLRAGFDLQRFRSTEAGISQFAGGVYYRYFVTETGSINGVRDAAAPGSRYVRMRRSTSTSGAWGVTNAAYYVEDSWQVRRDLMLYGGLRLESFDNQTADGVSFVRATNLPGPRTGFAWNARSDGSLKLFGSAGRYYIPVAANTSIRFTHGEVVEERYYRYAGVDPRTAAPLGLSAEIGDPIVSGDGRLPNPATLADTRLRPMNQDELVLGLEQALARGWTLGAKAIYRRVNDGMDDFCGRQAIGDWARAQGYERFDSMTLATCVLLNPGRDLHLQMDLNNDGALQEVQIPAASLGLPKYVRNYRALQVTLERPFDGRWGLRMSYVLSRSEGNAEGYVQSDLLQEDAGITQDFDFASFTHGARGALPNDRRHVFKLNGSYSVTPEIVVSANVLVQSGRPNSCLGFVPPNVGDYAESGQYTTASSYYCLRGIDQGAALTQRGTAGRLPWTRQLDVGLAWRPPLSFGKPSLQLDVFNLFNRRTESARSQQRDYSRADSKTPPYRLNVNYQAPTAFEAPRWLRLTARWVY